MQINSGDLGILALKNGKPGGRLTVPPAYYQTANDQPVQLNSANHWIASKIVPDTDFELQAISRYVSSVTIEGAGTLEIYSHDATNNQPGVSLKIFGTLGSGPVSNWTRLYMPPADQYQLYKGTTYWIIMKGADGADWSESTRRWNTDTGSMFPDSMPVSMFTTDGGTSWDTCLQDAKPALWNIILNSTDHHVPTLHYGRATGSYVYVPDYGIYEIPEEGLGLNCELLNADTLYYVYLYKNPELMLLEASTVEPTRHEGIAVKTGEPSRRLVGIIYPKEIQAGRQGPVDVMDRRLLAYPGMRKPCGKLNPYSTSTNETFDSQTVSWRQWMDSLDWRIEFVGNKGWLTAKAASNSGGAKGVSIGVDGTTPYDGATKSVGDNGGATVSASAVIKGALLRHHYAYPLMRVYSGPTHGWMYWENGQWENQASFNGEIEWGQ